MGLLEFIAIGLAYLSFGNWLSVAQPFKMQFYRFASGGSVVDALMGLIFGSIPAAVTIYLLSREDSGALWKIGAVTIVGLAIYFIPSLASPLCWKPGVKKSGARCLDLLRGRLHLPQDIHNYPAAVPLRQVQVIDPV